MPTKHVSKLQQQAGILDEKGASELFGIQPRTLREWEAKRGLPHFKLTAKVKRYRVADLLAWIERHRVETAA